MPGHPPQEEAALPTAAGSWLGAGVPGKAIGGAQE